jgi:nucleoside-diphosphate-sugar epimerase
MPTSISDRPYLLVLGMGYSAARFVQRHRGLFGRIAATTRRMDKGAGLIAGGIDAFQFDGQPSQGLVVAATECSHVLVSIPPGEKGDPALAALRTLLRANKALTWIGYLSTTGVYGDHHGKWIDEDTPVAPQNARSRQRVEAEEAWRALATDTRAVQIFRLSGIYGPGRNPLADLKAGDARRIAKPGQVFNRIHVDDIAQVLAAAVQKPNAGPIFNLADDEPAASEEVVAFAAKLLGREPPPLVPLAEAKLSEMAQSFWSENKRVKARRIQTELGVDLIYPTYREGLLALMAEGEGV